MTYFEMTLSTASLLLPYGKGHPIIFENMVARHLRPKKRHKEEEKKCVTCADSMLQGHLSNIVNWSRFIQHHFFLSV